MVLLLKIGPTLRQLVISSKVPKIQILPINLTLASPLYIHIPLNQPRPRPSIFIFIFLIFSAFSHEKTGTRWFGSGAEEGQIEGLVDFPTTRPKLPWNCPGCEMPNYCVLKQNYLQLHSEFKPRYRYNKLIYSINLLFLFVYTPRKSGFIHCTG
jgi:hypothetical protein